MAQSENVELSDRDKQIIESLRDWDLFGPLLICLGLGVLLSLKAPVGQASLVFATVFVTVWFGSAVVTINTQLLGGTISFFQSVCVLGYSVFPMTMAALVVDLFKMLPLGAFSVLVEIAVLFATFQSFSHRSTASQGQAPVVLHLFFQFAESFDEDIQALMFHKATYVEKVVGVLFLLFTFVVLISFLERS